MSSSPTERLEAWLAEALAAHDPARTSMVLSTADPTGAPSARIVLLKEISGGELVFGTSLSSRKGRELLARPEVSLVLFWPVLTRQVRVVGRARVDTRQETERVWRTRGTDGKLVDLVTDEGSALEDPEGLRRRVAAAEAEHGEDVPCPEDWAAVRVRPELIEFWSAGERRLAVRELYARANGEWRVTRLQP